MIGVDLFAQLVELDEKLLAIGFPAMSPFWRSTMERWLRSSKRWLVGRVGRRGGKGVMSAKLSVLFALRCPILNLSPGERAFVELLSVDKEEAGQRLRMIEAALKGLNVDHRVVGEEIELLQKDRPVTIRVRAASVRAVGGTAILILEDEVARWRDAATGVDPAREVHSSIAAELASQPFGRGCILSAPFGENDFHAQKFDEGETAYQCVARAATHDANPTITESETRALEPNPAVWEREYNANPVASVTAICSKEGLASVTSRETKRLPIPDGQHGMLIDPALVNDAWVITVVHRELREGPNSSVLDVIVQDCIVHLKPTFLRKLKLDECIAKTIEVARAYGVTTIDSDGHYSEAIGPRLAEHGLKLRVQPMTSTAMTARIENLQARIHAATIDLLTHAEQAKEILEAQLVAHPGGRLTLRAPERRGKHDDLVSALLLACDADAAAKLRPAGGTIEVEYERVNFDFDTRSLVGGRARYFRREGRHRVPCEPPYGTRAFIAYAQDMISKGASTALINRWVKELGLENKPGLDPALLDPNDPEASEARRRLATQTKK